MKIKHISHFKANSVMELFSFTSDGEEVSFELTNKKWNAT
jgi:hypothetical protein